MSVLVGALATQSAWQQSVQKEMRWQLVQKEMHWQPVQKKMHRQSVQKEMRRQSDGDHAAYPATQDKVCEFERWDDRWCLSQTIADSK